MTSREKLRRFEEQVAPHLGSAYNLARWLMRNHADAEDAVQEAFVRAFTGLESLRGDNARGWVLTIVRNTCLTWMKRHRLSETIALEDQLEGPREPSPDPEEALLITIDREQVRGALERLPIEFREAMVLRELEGLSYKEIAAITGVPMGTVMSRLWRGRESLKRLVLDQKKEPVS